MRVRWVWLVGDGLRYIQAGIGERVHSYSGRGNCLFLVSDTHTRSHRYTGHLLYHLHIFHIRSFMGSFDVSVGFISQFPKDILPSLTALFPCVIWKHGYWGLKVLPNYLEVQDLNSQVVQAQGIMIPSKVVPRNFNDLDLNNLPTFI